MTAKRFVKCPSCSKRYAASEDCIGKSVKCKECGSAFRIGDANQSASPQATVQTAQFADPLDPLDSVVNAVPVAPDQYPTSTRRPVAKPLKSVALREAHAERLARKRNYRAIVIGVGLGLFLLLAANVILLLYLFSSKDSSDPDASKALAKVVAEAAAGETAADGANNQLPVGADGRVSSTNIDVGSSNRSEVSRPTSTLDMQPLNRHSTPNRPGASGGSNVALNKSEKDLQRSTTRFKESQEIMSSTTLTTEEEKTAMEKTQAKFEALKGQSSKPTSTSSPISTATGETPKEPPTPLEPNLDKIAVDLPKLRISGAVAFSSNNEYLFLSGSSTSFFAYDHVNQRNIGGTYELGGYSDIDVFAISPEGKFLLAASGHEGKIAIFEIKESGLLVKTGTFVRHTREVKSISISPDSQLVLSGSSDNRVRLWRLGTRKEVTAFDLDSSVLATCITPDGKSGFASDGKRLLKINMESQKIIHRPIISDSHYTNGEFSADGSKLAVVSGSTVTLFDTASFGEIASNKCETSIGSLAFGPQGKYLYLSAKRVQQWDVQQDRVTNEYPAPQKRAGSIAISPDGTQLAVAAAYGSGLRVFNVSDTGNNGSSNKDINAAAEP